MAGSSSTLPTWCVFLCDHFGACLACRGSSFIATLTTLLVSSSSYERLLRHGAGAYVEGWQAYRTSATDRGNNKFPRI